MDLVPHPQNLEQNGQETFGCHFDRSEKSSALMTFQTHKISPFGRDDSALFYQGFLVPALPAGNKNGIQNVGLRHSGLIASRLNPTPFPNGIGIVRRSCTKICGRYVDEGGDNQSRIFFTYGKSKISEKISPQDGLLRSEFHWAHFLVGGGEHIREE